MTTTSRRACAPTHDCSSASGSTSPRARSCSSMPSTSMRRSCGRSPRRPTPPAPATSTSPTRDRWVQRAFVSTAPDEMLGWTPPWMVQRLERAIEVGAAVIGISADSGAEVYEGIDGDRLARARFRDFDLVVDGRRHGPQARVVARRLPDRGLGARGARRAGPRRACGTPSRMPCGSTSPIPPAPGSSAWTSSQARARELTERAFTALRYRGPGTDLEVGLIEGARWLAGRERTVHGQVHAPNLPTEEVFTSPHRLRAEGTVRSTMPLALRGTLVEGLELRVAGGEIVEARATPRRGRPARRARHRRRRAPLRRGRPRRRLVARRRDRRHLQQHALRRERRGPHRLGPRHPLGARPPPGRRARRRRPQRVGHPHGLHGRRAGGRDRRGRGRGCGGGAAARRGVAAVGLPQCAAALRGANSLIEGRSVAGAAPAVSSARTAWD